MKRAKHKKRRRPQHHLDIGSPYRIGAPPGTLEAHPEAAPSVIRRLVYDADRFSEERFEGAIPNEKLLREPNQVLWLDIVGLGSIDAVKSLAKSFELHTLALEDALHQRQHPKTETYGDTVFMVMRIPHVRENATVFEQVSLFLGPDFVLTFQEEEADCFDSIRDRIRGARGRIRRDGADYLAYALLDAVIDQYLPLADSMGDRMDDMEREVLSTSDAGVVERLLDLRGDINQLRRNVVPARDAVAAMDTIAGTLVSDDTKLYLRDCQDHIVQLHDLVEGYRDAVSTLVSLHLSMSSQRLNEVMRVLTVFAALFMPLGFIAGVYGMNFDPSASPYNMPELSWAWGYPAALALMLLVAGGLLVFFRRRGWLGAVWLALAAGPFSASAQGAEESEIAEVLENTGERIDIVGAKFADIGDRALELLPLLGVALITVIVFWLLARLLTSRDALFRWIENRFVRDMARQLTRVALVGDLALLVAYKLKSNWKQELVLTAQLRDDGERDQALAYLKSVAELARIPNTHLRTIGPADEGPADFTPAVTMFTLRLPADFSILREQATRTGTPCLFALDSGRENALA